MLQLPEPLQRELGVQLGRICHRISEHGEWAHQPQNFYAAILTLEALWQQLEITHLEQRPGVTAERNLVLFGNRKNGTPNGTPVVFKAMAELWDNVTGHDLPSSRAIEVFHASQMPMVPLLRHGILTVKQGRGLPFNRNIQWSLSERLDTISLAEALHRASPDEKRKLVDETDEFLTKWASNPVEWHQGIDMQRLHQRRHAPAERALKRFSRDRSSHHAALMRYLLSLPRSLIHTDLVASNLLVLKHGFVDGSRFALIDPDRTALGASEFDIAQFAVRTPDPMRTLRSIHAKASPHLSALGLLAATAIYARVDAGFFILPNNTLLEDMQTDAHTNRVNELKAFLAELEDGPCTDQARKTFARLIEQPLTLSNVKQLAADERATADNLLTLSDEVEQRFATGRENLGPVHAFKPIAGQTGTQQRSRAFHLGSFSVSR